VDEAHATGLFGTKGEGRVADLGLEKEVFARVHTFSKALGCHGAIVLGSETLKQFLLNFARPFVFTTALPFHSLVAVKCAYDILSNQQHRTLKINNLIRLFQQSLEIKKAATLVESESPIQSIILPGNDRALSVSRHLEKAGFYAKAILYPTVPRGKERIRIVLHSFNSEEEVLGIARTINQVFT
jgi:8-amino-7-oxononanoate synthase